MVNSPLIEAAKSTALDKIKASPRKLVGQGQRRHDDQSTPGSRKHQQKTHGTYWKVFRKSYEYQSESEITSKHEKCIFLERLYMI